MSRPKGSGGPGLSPALRFVILIGVVNLFADMTYEGARSVSGAFLGQLGASAFAVGLVAGGGELIGYVVRLGAGIAADRLGIYWIEAVVGYAINLLCVPALALAGNWPLAAGLVVGERLGRGIRKPAVAAMLAKAGGELGGAGRVFGINELLDQIGATMGPLIIALALARGSGYRSAFGFLLIPALLAILAIVIATVRFHRAAPVEEEAIAQAPTSKQYRLALVGGALFAAGFVDYALIAYHFNQTHPVAPATIPILYSVAMVVAAIGSPIVGRSFDRNPIASITTGIALSAAFGWFVFLGGAAMATAGIVLWGIGLAVQETAMIALVARISRGRGRGTAFGGFDAVFGVAWFAGSALTGFLYGWSLPAVVLFSAGAQLAAIPFFVAAATDAAQESAA